MSEVKTIELSSAVVYVAYTEAPCAEVSVTYGRNAIPQLNISFPACEELERLGQEDRVPVVVFYLDQWYSDTDAPPVPRMRLLFDGEISGWGYSRSAFQQYITFSCQAHISILESASAQFFFTDLKNYAPGAVSQSNSQTVTLPDDLANGQGFLLKKGLFPGSGEVERPFDFIANILLAMKIGGKPHPDKCSSEQAGPRVSKGQAEKTTGEPQLFNSEFINYLISSENQEDLNPAFFAKYLDQHPSTVSAIMAFFVKYVQRSKLDKRFIASSLEKFILANTLADGDGKIQDVVYEVIKTEAMTRLVKGSFQSIFGQGDSYLRMISSFYSFVYYELLMLPTAQYVPVGRLWTDSASTHPGVPNKSEANYHLGNYISKPMTQFSIPPGCNVIFPCMVTDFRYQENYQAQPTRTISSNQFMDANVPGVLQGEGGIDLALHVAKTEAYPISARPANRGQSKGSNDSDEGVSEEDFLGILVFPEEFFRGPLTNFVTIPSWYQFLKNTASAMSKELSTFANGAIIAGLGKSTTVDYMDTTSITQTILSNAQPANYVEVLDAARLGKLQTYMTSAGAFDTSEICKTFIRMLHYEARYAQRAGSMELVFNPYIVPSFPFAYLDDKLYNIHTFGMVDSITHRISATSGWATSVNFSYGRTMKEVYEEAITEFITEKDPVFYESSPKMPNKTVAMMTQLNTQQPGYPVDGTNAKDYYRNLFYITNSSTKKKVSFDFRDYFETSFIKGGKNQDVNTEVPKVEVTTRKHIVSTGGQGPLLNPTFDKEVEVEDVKVSLKLKDISLAGVKVYSDAMRVAARPICTLEEYIEFLGIKNHPRQNEIPISKYGISVPVMLVESQKTFYEAGYQRPFPVMTSEALANKSKYTFRRDWAQLVRAYRLKVHNKIISVD